MLNANIIYRTRHVQIVYERGHRYAGQPFARFPRGAADNGNAHWSGEAGHDLRPITTQFDALNT